MAVMRYGTSFKVPMTEQRWTELAGLTCLGRASQRAVLCTQLMPPLARLLAFLLV